ncbi:efflux RND transporter periplasmic adaptor subunit [Chloroflexota bacterium]
MKVFKIALIILLLGSVSVLSLSCASDSDSAPSSENQAVTVQRGNLTIDITAAGNLALSRTEELAFDLFSPATARETVWTVEEVLVETGDLVEKGQVLAKVDTSEWDEGLSTLEDAVTTAERLVTAKKRALIQYELNLIDAKNALEDTLAQYVWSDDIFTARQAVWRAESQVEEAEAMLGEGLVREIYDPTSLSSTVTFQDVRTAGDIKVWTDRLITASDTLQAARVNLDELLAASAANAKVTYAEERLRAAQVKLDELIVAAVHDTEADRIERNEKIAAQRLKIELAQQRLEDAQNALDGVNKKRLLLEQAEGNVDDAHLAIKDAETSLGDAQQDLDEAISKSPLITATFDGFVVEVNVEGGDEITTGTVAVVIADPNKFEADILVSEMDILQIKLGGEALVQVDAMSGISLSANVTHISPTATIQSGVVNYEVKVEVQSLPSNEKKRQEVMENVEQEQGGQSRGRQQEPISAMVPQELQLREGLTVTVSIIVDEATDVLLVPNSAITRRGKDTIVEVLKNGVAEERNIQPGVTDYQFTEVTDGLSEGEQIIVPQGTITNTPSTTPSSGIPREMRRILQ